MQLGARAEQLPIKNYTTADGLAQNSINRIVRDSHGFLWFCTLEGLSRFDGYAFTNYGTEHGLPHRIVSDILETRSGIYWVATHGGLVRFDPKGTPTFAPLTPAKAITAVRQGNSGTIWVGTSLGVYALDCSGTRCSLRTVDVGIRDASPQMSSVEDLIEDRTGNLWVATPNGLYRRAKTGATAHFTEDNGLPDHYLHTLFEDSRGRLWVGSRHAGFFRLDTTDADKPRMAEQFIHTTAGHPMTWIYQITQTSDGSLWVGGDRGLVQVTSGNQLHAFGTRNGLTQHQITTLTEDGAGNLWLGTSSAGAMKVARDGFVTFGERDGLLGVNAIFGDRENGVYFRGYVVERPDPLRPFDVYLPRFGKLDGDRITWLLPDALNLKNIGWVGEHVTLRARSGEWWVGTGKGLQRFPSVAFDQLKSARPIAVYTSPQIFRLFEDSRGDMWFSTAASKVNSLARWHHDTMAIEPIDAVAGKPLANELARSFGEDASGNVWIGFSDSLVRYRDGRFAIFTAKDGLPPGGINDMHLDRTGRLWIASSAAGVLRIDKPDAERPAFRTYSTRDGLSSNLAEVLTEDASGRIYAGTGRALDRIDPITGRIRHFTTADGLAPGRFLGAFADRDGTLWFGTEKGLTRYVPGREVASASPSILVNGVTIAGSPRKISAVGERALTLPQLPPDHNQVQFDVVALSFAAGQSLRYQYKLEGGRDAAWSAPTEQRTIHYANLSPSAYTFSARAINSDGLASPIPATVRFTILPHLWQQWWFIALAAACLAAIAYAAYRYRVKRLVEVANIRASIAADLHDDIGANLTRIAILSEVAQRQLGSSSEEGPLPSIARISRESVSAMSDIVWAINPERDSVIDLLRRMRRHAEEVFASELIKLEFLAPPSGDHLKLGPVLRRDLFLIFKEAVNNAARHSHCTRVEIELSVDGAFLLLRVEDNGTGFDADYDKGGQGLISMRRRAKKMGGTLDIDSRAGQGTIVRLRAPWRSSRWSHLPEHVGDSVVNRE